MEKQFVSKNNHDLEDVPMTDEELTSYCGKKGIRVRTLSSYYHLPIPESDRRCLVINYAGLPQEALEAILDRWDQV